MLHIPTINDRMSIVILNHTAHVVNFVIFIRNKSNDSFKKLLINKHFEGSCELLSKHCFVMSISAVWSPIFHKDQELKGTPLTVVTAIFWTNQRAAFKLLTNQSWRYVAFNCTKNGEVASELLKFKDFQLSNWRTHRHKEWRLDY